MSRRGIAAQLPARGQHGCRTGDRRVELDQPLDQTRPLNFLSPTPGEPGGVPQTGAEMRCLLRLAWSPPARPPCTGPLPSQAWQPDLHLASGAAPTPARCPARGQGENVSPGPGGPGGSGSLGLRSHEQVTAGRGPLTGVPLIFIMGNSNIQNRENFTSSFYSEEDLGLPVPLTVFPPSPARVLSLGQPGLSLISVPRSPPPQVLPEGSETSSGQGGPQGDSSCGRPAPAAWSWCPRPAPHPALPGAQ